MRPLLFWTFYALAKLKFAVDFGFPWTLLVVIIWLVGLNLTFQKLFPISGQISNLCARFAQDMDHQNQTGNNFFEVFKGREEILFHPHLSLCQALFSAGWEGCHWERSPGVQRHNVTPHSCTAPNTCMCSCALGTWVWLSKHDHAQRCGACSRWVLMHNFRMRTTTKVNLNSMIFMLLPSLGFSCPQPFVGEKDWEELCI